MEPDLEIESYYYSACEDRNNKAQALLQRQLNDEYSNRQSLSRLQQRTDYVVKPGVIGNRGQSLNQIPTGDIQRLPVGEQIVRNPQMLRQVISPTPMKAVPPAKPISAKPYSPKIKQYPMQNANSILYAGGLPTGMPVKKWPTSFKKAYHKPTTDEVILRGLNNLDNMSNSLLGGRKQK